MKKNKRIAKVTHTTFAYYDKQKDLLYYDTIQSIKKLKLPEKYHVFDVNHQIIISLLHDTVKKEIGSIKVENIKTKETSDENINTSK